MLTSLGGGAGSWRIVRSKGSRGWYVDSASGWIAEAGEGAEGDKAVLRRDLEKDHPWRKEIERLADLNGNVSSGVGWHARKMEVRQVLLAVVLLKHCADSSCVLDFARPWLAWT